MHLARAYLVAIFGLVLFCACTRNTNQAPRPMDSAHQALHDRKTKLLKSMVAYKEAAPHAPYAKYDINECDRILTAYLAEVDSPSIAGNGAKITELVKDTVFALNDLNARCDDVLIETDQREYIVTILLDAAALAGLRPPNDDITFEWRNW